MKWQKFFSRRSFKFSMSGEGRLVLMLISASMVIALAITAIYRENIILAGNAETKPKIIVIFKSIDYNLAFWQTVKDGIESASKDFDVNFVILGPISETQIDEQIKIVKDSIQAKPDAIVLAAADYDRLVPVAKEIKAAHIPLVTIDSFINGNDADVKIGTDNYDAGQKAGAVLMSHLKPMSQIVIMSYVQGSSSAIDRESGVRDYLKGKAIIKETEYSGGETDIAYTQTKNLLLNYPDVSGIVALNDPTTIGVAHALDESGKKQDVVLIGFDDSQAVLSYVEAGVIRDTIVQRPFNMGYLGIKTAMEIIKGKKVETFIDTGSKVINRQNMLLPENQKLLFPVNR